MLQKGGTVNMQQPYTASKVTFSALQESAFVKLMLVIVVTWTYQPPYLAE